MNKPGRNQPCPCGSGKKYKRCCLLIEEAAAHERLVQQALFDDDEIGADDALDVGAVDDEHDASDEDEFPRFPDVGEIIRVCYTRGLVGKFSELRSGRGVQITEWEAPQVPDAVLDAIDEEALDSLEGTWGDPRAAEPVQVDIIDLESETDVVSIEVYNRGVALVTGDSGQMQRIHRACEVIQVTALIGQDRRMAGGPSLAVSRDGVTIRTVKASGGIWRLHRVP